MADVGLKNRDVQADLRAQREDYYRGCDALRTATFTSVVMFILAVLGYSLTFAGIDPQVFRIVGVVGLIGTTVTLMWALWLILDLLGNRAPLRWFCANCDKSLNDAVDWTCGHCDFRNQTKFLLGPCEHCNTVPSSYECPFCRSLTYFTKDRVARLPARHRILDPEETRSIAEVREERARELEELEHTRQRLEADRARLDVENRVADLKNSLAAKQPKAGGTHDAMVARISTRIEEVKLKCRSIKDVARCKAEMLAEIDTDPQYPEELKPLVKQTIGLCFESIEIELSRSVPLE